MHPAVRVAFLLLALAANAVSAPRPQAPIQIPFELSGNTPYLRVRVNGSEPMAFIVDTGASFTVMNRTRAEPLGSKVKILSRSKTDGSIELAMAKDVTLETPGVTLTGVTVILAPLDRIEPSAGRRVDGVLGRDLFDRYVVEFDYVAGTLTLHDPATYRYAGAGAVMPISIKDGNPYVRATIVAANGVTLEDSFLVDTGATAHLVRYTAPAPAARPRHRHALQPRHALDGAPRAPGGRP